MRTHKINLKYNPKFKISCIIDMRTNKLGYLETARKYNLGYNPNQGKNLLKNWERIFLEEGEGGFFIERRGRTTKMNNPNKGRKKKFLPKNIKQDLVTENQNLREQLEYLKAENEYLKKLDALVRAEEQKKSKRH